MSMQAATVQQEGRERPIGPQRHVHRYGLYRAAARRTLRAAFAPKEGISIRLKKWGRISLKLLVFVLVWAVFPFWFFLWLTLAIIGWKNLLAWWEGAMKDILSTMYYL